MKAKAGWKCKLCVAFRLSSFYTWLSTSQILKKFLWIHLIFPCPATFKINVVSIRLLILCPSTKACSSLVLILFTTKLKTSSLKYHNKPLQLLKCTRSRWVFFMSSLGTNTLSASVTKSKYISFWALLENVKGPGISPAWSYYTISGFTFVCVFPYDVFFSGWRCA